MQHLRRTNTRATLTQQCAEEVIEVIPAVMRTIRGLMRAQRSADLSVPQFRALGYVHRHPRTSLSAVAEHLGLSAPTVSRLIESLVSRGLVEREVAVTDRRYVTLQLSAQGTDLLTRTRQGTVRELTALLAGLEETEQADIMRGLRPLRTTFAAPARAVAEGTNDAETARGWGGEPRDQGEHAERKP